MKIGFLALSGIRAHDPELLALGLTLPGFVERSRKVAELPSLGLLQLAACTPPGHELGYFEAEADGAEPPEVYGCDLVAISTFSAQVFEAYAIADRLRAAGVRVAMGGLHVSALPEEALPHADYVAIGEGEPVWPAIVAAAERGAPPAVFDARALPPVDLAALPAPRYDLLTERPYDRFPLQTTRGCPWRCEFCASTVMLGRPYRKKPPARVVRDAEAVLALFPEARFEFADDDTFVDKRWGKELCRALEPLGIRWFTETDLSVADDPELLDAMARAGCRSVLIGLEAPDPAVLRGVEARSDFKARRAGDQARAVRAIQSRGIAVHGCFVLGLDGQTRTDLDRVADHAEALGLHDVQITVLTPFPGTPFHERMAREGRLLEPGRWDLCTLFDVNVRPSAMTPEELREGLRALSARLYSAEAVARRRRAFHRARRRGLFHGRASA